MSGAACVMAREDGLELRHAVGVRLLDAAEESRVDIRGVVGVAVSVGDDAGVDALTRSASPPWFLFD